MSHLPPLPGEILVGATAQKDPDDRLGIPSCKGDPIVFLEHVMDSPKVSFRARMAAAVAMLPYKHSRLGEEGKKVKQKGRAEGVVGGRLSPRPAPGVTVQH